MNPYWINPKPDSDEFLHSEKVKAQFFLLVAGHIVLWVIALVGVVVTYQYAQKAPQIEAFTAGGEPAWGQPIASNSDKARETEEAFLDMHLRDVISHIFMCTEKGIMPALQPYADMGLLLRIYNSFKFTETKKGGWSQSFQIEEFERVQGDVNSRRRIYRVKGNLSAHSLDGASNTTVYLLVAVDQRGGNQDNPLGWVVTIILSVDDKTYYAKERQTLVDEVTKSSNAPAEAPQTQPLKNTPKKP